MRILFLHGWQSIPDGVKPTYLGSQGYSTIDSKVPTDDLQEAVNVAQEKFDIRMLQPPLVRAGPYPWSQDSKQSPSAFASVPITRCPIQCGKRCQ